jgi:hypothetical protein
MVVTPLPRNEVLAEHIAQAGWISFPPSHQLSRELCLGESVCPLAPTAGWAHTRLQEGSDRRLETSVIGAVRDIVEPSGGELAFRARQTLLCLSDVDVTLVYHDAIIRAGGIHGGADFFGMT